MFEGMIPAYSMAHSPDKVYPIHDVEGRNMLDCLKPAVVHGLEESSPGNEWIHRKFDCSHHVVHRG